jgi:putative endonuclease
MKTNRQKLGKKGEDMAVAFLQNKGYEIIKRNFYAGQNELDIIATDKFDLVIVEVKSIRNPDYGSAEFRIPLKKQRSIIKATYAYLEKHREFADLGVRFDVICVNLEKYPAGVVHYKGAFWQGR